MKYYIYVLLDTFGRWRYLGFRSEKLSWTLWINCKLFWVIESIQLPVLRCLQMKIVLRQISLRVGFDFTDQHIVRDSFETDFLYVLALFSCFEATRSFFDENSSLFYWIHTHTYLYSDLKFQSFLLCYLGSWCLWIFV